MLLGSPPPPLQAPPAPPLLAGMLFHRSARVGGGGVGSAFDAQPFRAKANPFNSGGGGGSGGRGGEERKQQHPHNDSLLAPPPQPSFLSSPPPPSHHSHAHAYSNGSSPAANSARSSPPASGGSASGDVPWKAHLREQCLQRVKQQRSSLLQKLRNLPANESSPPPMMHPSTSAAAAQAHAALADSLRDIIQEQYAEQRSQSAGIGIAGTRSPTSAAAGASSSASACAASSPFHHAAAQASPSPSALSSSGLDAASFPSFTAGDEFLSQDELIELMFQLEQEVRRETEHQQPQQQWMSDGAASSSSSSAAAAASNSSAASAAAAAAAEAQWLAAAHDADVAEQYEADMAALSEYEQVAAQQLLPCPVCRRISVSVHAAAGGSGAQCSSCGLRYACDSAAEFRQHLSDACELHALRCSAPPNFLTPQYSRAAPSSASSSSSSSQSTPHGPALALACERCQTWLTLPVQVAGSGWNSHPCSQASASSAQDEDHDMGM